MLKKTVLALSLTLSPFAFSSAQEARMETIVVTGSKIQDMDLTEIPNATLRVTADFVLFELTYVNGSVDLRERKSEMERMYAQVLKEIPRHAGISLSTGEVGSSAPIETAVFDEVYYGGGGGNRGYFSLVVRAEISEGETHQDIRRRVMSFINGAGEFGRSQSILSDEQYLGIDNLKEYRPALIKAIWDDIYAVSNPVGDTELEIRGLEQRTQYHPVGPLELELFIPYEIEYASKVAR